MSLAVLPPSQIAISRIEMWLLSNALQGDIEYG